MSSDARRFSLFAPDFHLVSSRPWVLFDHVMEIPTTDLRGAILESGAGQLDAAVEWDGPLFEPFRAGFEDLQKKFQSGELRKAVPVTFEMGRLRGDERSLPGPWLACLLESTARLPLHLYGYWSGGEGILGATPEILFELPTPRTLRTMALAGTRPAGSDQLPLLEDPKERSEHAIVIEGVRQALAGFGVVQVGETRELQLPALSHLIAPIEVELKRDPDFVEMARALHPTPALGAFPREAGQRWLESYQKLCAPWFDRLRFGAPFGAGSLCLVGIRNIQWKGNQVMLGAGCGIIPESVLDREWREIQAKMRSVKGLFGL